MEKPRTVDVNKYWPNAWKVITKALTETRWEDFRGNPESTKYIEVGGVQGRRFWREQCEEEEIPPEEYKDSLIGNPTKERCFDIAGVPATANSCRFAHYVHIISKHFNPEGSIRVMELGAGYGGLAEQLCRKYKISKYFFLDKPIMQTLQGYYMIKAGLGHIVSFEPPTDIDLIVSVGGTLSEMSMEEATKYIRIFENALKPEVGLMYLAQQKKAGGIVQTPGDGYPFDDKWNMEVSQNVRSKMLDYFGRRTK